MKKQSEYFNRQTPLARLLRVSLTASKSIEFGNTSSMLMQYSRDMRAVSLLQRSLNVMYNDDYIQYLQHIQSVIRNMPVWDELAQQQMKTATILARTLQPMTSKSDQIVSAIGPLLTSQTKILHDRYLPDNHSYLYDTLAMQMDVLVQANLVVNTPELNKLIDSFQHADWINGMSQFVQSISKSYYTQAANVAFLCASERLGEIMPENTPTGMKSFMRSIRKRTVQRLAESSEIEVNCTRKIFRPMHNPEHTVDVSGMNLIASSTELFKEINETELMELMDTLAKEPEFGGNCEAGRKIREIIHGWNNFIDFDQEYFYHARAMAENGCPYTSQEMGQAPHFYVGMGRYNHVGQSHYYFSDKEEGAKIEVNRHNRGARVQIARLRPRRRIRLLDLSEEIVGNNMFLQYIRFEASNGTAPREYLIPCYVASCCRRVEIEGIKYYGSKEYKNYVSWSDGYFDVETTWEL